MRSFIIAIIAGLMLFTGIARAESQLPAAALREDVFVAAHMDLTKLDAAAAKAALGDVWTQAEPLFKEGLAKRDKFVAAGVTSMTMLGLAGERGPAGDAAALHLGPNADEDAIRKLTENMVYKGVAQREGDWMIIKAPRPDAAPVADDRAAVIAAALKSVEGRALSVVLIPTSGMARDAQKFASEAPEPVRPVFELAPLGARAKWLAVWTDAGPGASAFLKAQFGDEESAQKLIDAQAPAVAGMKNLGAMIAASGGRMPMELTAVSMFAPALESLMLKRDGTTVNGTLDGKAVQAVAAGVVGPLIAARKSAQGMVAANSMRQLALAVIMYTTDQGDSLPDKFDDLAPYLGDAEAMQKLLTHPITGEKPGFIYAKPGAKMSDVKDPSTTVILWEAKGGKPDPDGYLGYLDGHVAKAAKPAPAKP